MEDVIGHSISGQLSGIDRKGRGFQSLPCSSPRHKTSCCNRWIATAVSWSGGLLFDKPEPPKKVCCRLFHSAVSGAGLEP